MGYRSKTSASQCISLSTDCRVLRAVLGVLLCLALSSAAPVDHTVLGQFDSVMDADEMDTALSFLAFLRSLLNFQQLQNDSTADDISNEEDIRAFKRGFGIAGLDNVDMITSTLDRSRAMSRGRPGRRYLSSGLTFQQLRALMERAG